MSLNVKIVLAVLAIIIVVNIINPLDNPQQDIKYEKLMMEQNKKELGYISTEKYMVEIPEEINQAKEGELLKVLTIKDDTLVLGFPLHYCSDSQHIKCDGECECDGLGCNEAGN